jgi:hypothetical protein
MAISWGSWDYGTSSAGFRVGLDVTQSSVTSASSSVTWTIKVYVEAMYNVDDAMTVSYSGNISGSSTQNLTTGSSGGTKLWATLTHTYNYSTYGTSPGTRTFRADLDGVYNSADPYKSVTVTIPARPYAAPAAPSSVTATRNSDTQATVAWTRNATTAAPYTSVTVQRGYWTGSAWSAWTTVATTSSTATSFVDTGVAANNQYRYQVKANNSVGSSAYVAASVYVKMTPAAPSNASAALQSSGTSIALSWQNNHYLDTNITLTIQRSVAGGAYANVATGLAYTTATWTDNAPGAGTNTYRVTAVQSVGSLSSAAATTNTVSTTVPPLAPTSLSPNGIAVDWTQAQVLTWTHNPGGDQAAQTAFILEYSNDSGSTWLALNGSGTASSVSSYTVPANTLTNGVSRLWRVRTRGVASAGYGPNSASATVVGSGTPVTTITGPATTITALPATVTWTYSQAQGSAQAAYEVTLYKSGQVVESASGTSGTSYTLTAPLQQGASYTVSVRTRSAAGLWSVSATRSLTVSLLPPGGVYTSPSFQAETGTAVLHLEAVPAPAATRTNLATAPWAPTSPIAFQPNNAYWTVTRGVAIDDHPQGIPTAAQVVVTNAASAGNTIVSQYNIDGLAGSTTARGGGVWIKPPAPVRVSVDGGTGTESWVEVPANVWTYVASGSMTSTYMQVKAQLLNGATASGGEVTYLTGSVAEAGVASPSWFDGSSPWGAWSGTPGASSSTVAAANAVATQTAIVERRIPGGDWVRLIEVPLPNDVLDLLPATKGTTEYRITATSATPTYREEVVVEVTANGGDWVLVNYGDGFTSALRFRSNAEVSATAGRERVNQRFLGRARPVPRIGQSRTRVVTASGNLVHDPSGADTATLWDSPPEDWETAAQESEVVCYRDYTGRRIFGLLSDVSVSHIAPGLASVGFTVEESEWTEAYA